MSWRIFLLGLSLSLGFELYGQEALFFTSAGKADQDEISWAKDFRWRIRGQELIWGGDTLRLKPKPGHFDTLFFQTQPTAKWDTLICQIQKAGKYGFEYNPCCGGFNTRNAETQTFPTAEVEFVRKGKAPELSVGGVYGSSMVLMDDAKLICGISSCTSAMAPNIASFGVGDWSMMSNDETGDFVCYFDENGVELPGADQYKVAYWNSRMQFVPLENCTIQVIWNARKRTVEYKLLENMK